MSPEISSAADLATELAGRYKSTPSSGASVDRGFVNAGVQDEFGITVPGPEPTGRAVPAEPGPGC